MAGRRRQGYTLLEILLVLAIIVITTGLAIPLMDNMFGGNHLVQAGDLVKSRLNEMRTRAKDEGRKYKMTISEDGAIFRIEPLTEDGTDSATLVNFQTEDQLPKDVVFRPCTCVSCDGEGEVGTTQEIVINSDGSAAFDYEIPLTGTSENRGVVVRLRGLTGAISSAPMNGESGR